MTQERFVATKNDTKVPFLKWAGGKRWLVNSSHQIVPSNYQRYIEPFLGSAAVYFSIKPAKSLLADANLQLINTYKAIRDEPDNVARILKKHQKLHDHNYYYQVRSSNPTSVSGRAAKFIYLNRTCWNGLYRVNLKGEFNVPIGTKSKVIMESDKFEDTSLLLKKSKILCQDFETTINQANAGDFIFVDPPYTVKHNNNGFVKYNENIFSWEDQIRLRDAILRAQERGAMITLSNADHDSILDLYSDVCEIVRINRNSVLAANKEYRGKTSELLMKFGWS